MKYSENLNLNLPEGADPVDISKLSENFERLDVAVTDAASPFKIGDILPTLRTDLGEDWILCNGEPLDAAQYPKLAGMVPGLEAMVSAATVSNVGSPLNGEAPGADAFATDGINQLVTTAQFKNRITNYLLWSNDNFNTHTSISAGYCMFIRPFFVNGYWIIFLFHSSAGANESVTIGNTRATKISAKPQPFTDLSNAVAPPSTVNILDVYHVEYTDGKYYAFCAETGTEKAMVLTSTSPDFSHPTIFYPGIVSPNTIIGGSPFSFLRTEDQFIFLSYKYSKLYGVAWSSNPTSGYQTRTVDQASQTTVAARAFQGYGKPLYAGGKVFWVGTSGSDSLRKITIVCLNGIESGNVTYMELDGTTSVGDCTSSVFETGRGEYALFWYDSSTESYLMIGTDLLDASTWKKCSLGTKATQASYHILQHLDNGVLSAFTRNNTLVSVPVCAAPKIGLSNCYAYIKAK